MEHKVRFNEPATIWLINQVKCGTKSIQNSIGIALQCQIANGKPWEQFDCSGGKKVFHGHGSYKYIEKVKAMVDEENNKAGTKPDRCIVVTAVRNPLNSIPSRFFQLNRKRFCAGAQSKEKIIEEYEEFLLGGVPVTQVNTTAHMLRAFGAQNILETMKLLSDNGYIFLSQPEENGVWAGCELLFLQIDYDESNSNLDKGLDHAIESVKMIPQHILIEDCPKAEDNYHAVQNHGISNKLIKKFSKINHDFHDVITYYQNQQANTSKEA